MNIKGIGVNAKNWIASTQDGNYWRGPVNAALNPGFHGPWSYLCTKQFLEEKCILRKSTLRKQQPS